MWTAEPEAIFTLGTLPLLGLLMIERSHAPAGQLHGRPVHCMGGLGATAWKARNDEIDNPPEFSESSTLTGAPVSRLRMRTSQPRGEG